MIDRLKKLSSRQDDGVLESPNNLLPLGYSSASKNAFRISSAYLHLLGLHALSIKISGSASMLVVSPNISLQDSNGCCLVAQLSCTLWGCTRVNS